MRGKEPHLGRRALGSASAHTWPDKAYHMCVLAGRRYCLVFVLPAAEAMRVKWKKPRKFSFYCVKQFLPSWLHLQKTKKRRGGGKPGLWNLRVIISFSQLSANIFVVCTFLLRTITKLEHFLCKGHTQLLAQLSVSMLRAWDSASLLCLVLIEFLA